MSIPNSRYLILLYRPDGHPALGKLHYPRGHAHPERPLYYIAIIKIGEHEGGILVKTHHLISDGWSQVSLINRIAETYLALLSGETVALDKTPSYKLHVEDEQKYLSSRAFKKDSEYWKDILKNVPQPVSIKECSNAQVSPVGLRSTFFLSETLNHALSSFAQAIGLRHLPYSIWLCSST